MADLQARSLTVWCNQARVGTLGEYNNLWHFEYHPQWKAFDLAPELPIDSGRIEDGASQRPVQWFFDNLLPEENARALLARDAKLDQADAFGLLTHYGAESAVLRGTVEPYSQPAPHRPFSRHQQAHVARGSAA